MAGEYVYILENLTKQQGTKTILDDVTLAFFHGAKIGVIGPNGSGKTSLLRIMAGIDTEHIGAVQRAKSATVGYLEQAPQLDPEVPVQAINRDLPPLFAAFHDDEDARTCPNCGHLHPGRDGRL